ncbi:ATP-binding protein [Parabacteroides faecis]|uniref:ATP-binding protein n=1 Tax=Parabacteroides TaxID=375288 RepID=UPI000F00935F|nr:MULTISPECIES: ATP-binding protein [Parabacteroides]MBC8617962.1 ATP-binding protein [Parabacteroides faecis]RHR99283.1 ATP-binding protein [Parabacteroides sp. AF14-59]
MNTLTFHITDIASNSVRAGATRISLEITIHEDHTTVRITDNGCGMDAETVSRITNPFYTTRTTRKVGLGIPFLIQNAEQTGGHVSITSEPGKGTAVTACFITSNIDCPPMGDLPGTVAMLISGNPGINVCFSYRKEELLFEISSEDLRSVFEDIPLSYPKVILAIREMIAANLS